MADNDNQPAAQHVLEQRKKADRVLAQYTPTSEEVFAALCSNQNTAGIVQQVAQEIALQKMRKALLTLSGVDVEALSAEVPPPSKLPEPEAAEPATEEAKPGLKVVENEESAA